MMRSMGKMYDLIDRIDWLTIEPKLRGEALKPDDLAISFVAGKHTKPDEINRVKVRFGIDIIKEMGWESGDSIGVFYDPDNLMSFMFAKVDTKGFKLYREKANLRVFNMQFKWDRNLKLEFMKSRRVKYHILKGRIAVFHVNNQDEYYNE